MRIAMVSEHASPLATIGGVDAGGQNVFVDSLAAALTRRGNDVVVYTRRDDPGLSERVTAPGGYAVRHVDAGPPEPMSKDEMFVHMPAFADALRREWTLSPPDAVHAHFWMSGWAACSAARPLGIPVVQTFHALGTVKRRHQGKKDTSPPERQSVELDVLECADHILATCSDEVFELVRMGGGHHKISVVPCGVDLTLFSPDGPSAPRGESPRVVVVTRLVERKGVGNVIEAVAQLPGVEVLVAGGPSADSLAADPEAQRFTGLADRLGVSDRVRLLGRVDHRHVPELMRSADVVVCVPWYEPFGMVAVEAMACGVPVIASAVGGQIDTIIDGIVGLHVPPRRPDLLAEALGGLLADPALRQQFGAAGATRARSRYGWDRVAELTESAYAAVCRGRVAAEVTSP